MPPALKIRVIAGKYRHRILQNDSETTRPTKDRVKEALFSSLGVKVDGAHVVDLFAGTGALGIEALSRGATYCYFVENSRDALRTLKQNVSFVEEPYQIFEKSYEQFLLKTDQNKIDIIFIDPPYNYELNHIITLIIQSNILKKDAVIVIESDHRLDITLTDVTIKQYKYGLTHITTMWRNL